MTLAERLRKLKVDPRGVAPQVVAFWPEVCAVVEAAVALDGTSPRWVALNEALAALGRRLDEEGL